MHSRCLIVTTLLGAAFLPLQASAEEADQAVMLRAGDIFGIAAVDSQDLAFSRGGAELDITLNDVKSHGAVSNNQASNLTTGSNFVNDGSFAGAAGFSTVVQNSGNNVLIQNATIINLQVK
ncbi:MAG: hypothetical protein IPP03_15645 [Dechloromonas sp.]|mgnify:CR=1 FL=1|jgi:hypothetical protein|nr:hypothetical protein [Candidatus Dechloromonas phosphoritropha]